MDDEIYNRKLHQIKLEVDKVDDKRKNFMRDDVHVTQKDGYLSMLQSIQDAEGECQIKILEFVYELNDDDTADQARIKTLKTLGEELKQRVKQNANEVNIRMAELIKNAPLSDVEKETLEMKKRECEERRALHAKKADVEKSKVMTKLNQCLSKANSLISTMKDEKNVEEMTEQEVRVAILVKTKDWKIDLASLRKVKEEFDLDVSGLDFEESEKELVQKLEVQFKKAEEDVVKVMKALIEKDEELGLFTLAPLKNKEHISYPKVFSGFLGENVHKFITQFQLAIDADHVRTKDRIKVLLKYLDADARTAVGEHTQNLTTAFDILRSTYGNPSLIWNNVKENSLKSLGKPNVWGNVESVARRNSITKLLDFINEAKVLASDHDLLKTEIKSRATVKHIWNLAPKNIRDDFAKEVLCSQTVDEQFDVIEKVLINHRDRTITRLAFETVPEELKVASKKPAHCEPASNTVRSKEIHDCESSLQCRSDWGILGCVKLYEISEVADRTKLLRAHKLCFKCGNSFSGSFSRPHRCYWKGKFKAKCTEKNCWKAAALCKEHSDNASSELLAWLNGNDVKFIATTAFVRNLQCHNFIQKVSKSKRKRSKSKFSHMSNVVQYGNDYSDQRNTVEESENAYEDEVFDDNYSEAFTDEFFDLHKIHKVGSCPLLIDQKEISNDEVTVVNVSDLMQKNVSGDVALFSYCPNYENMKRSIHDDLNSIHKVDRVEVPKLVESGESWSQSYCPTDVPMKDIEMDPESVRKDVNILKKNIQTERRVNYFNLLVLIFLGFMCVEVCIGKANYVQKQTQEAISLNQMVWFTDPDGKSSFQEDSSVGTKIALLNYDKLVKCESLPKMILLWSESREDLNVCMKRSWYTNHDSMYEKERCFLPMMKSCSLIPYAMKTLWRNKLRNCSTVVDELEKDDDKDDDLEGFFDAHNNLEPREEDVTLLTLLDIEILLERACRPLMKKCLALRGEMLSVLEDMLVLVNCNLH